MFAFEYGRTMALDGSSQGRKSGQHTQKHHRDRRLAHHRIARIKYEVHLLGDKILGIIVGYVLL